MDYNIQKEVLHSERLLSKQCKLKKHRQVEKSGGVFCLIKVMPILLCTGVFVVTHRRGLMGNLKRILGRLAAPGKAVVIISIPIAAVLLLYTFSFDREDEPIAYISYIISAYSLFTVCVQAVKIFKEKKFMAVLHKNKYVHRYLTDTFFNMHVSLYVSLGINLLYAAMKIFYGIYYSSVWFGTLAIYYIMLAVMRFLLLRHVNRNSFGQNMFSELKHYRLCGIILMLMNIVLSGVIVLVINKNEGFEYAGYLIYIMAMYAFYNVITAVINVKKYRKYNSPVMSAAKAINLAAALVSLLSLETAMLTQFGNETNSSPFFREIMILITGGAICVIILGAAILMIVRSTRKLKQYKTEK